MNGSLAEAVLLVRELQSQLVGLIAASAHASIDLVIAPPFTAIAVVAEQLRLVQLHDVHLPPKNVSAKNAIRNGSLHLELGAQTMSDHERGAFTGEISPSMLHELGVRWVILGHSEQRLRHGESDETIGAKVRLALDHGITPILAVGDTLAEHEAGQSIERVIAQTRLALASLDPAQQAKVVIAYEPIWAIGTGHSDTPEHANATMQAIRHALPGLADARFLYGGSVNAHNAADFFAESDIDGALVGGASLNATSFLSIAELADTAGRIINRR